MSEQVLPEKYGIPCMVDGAYFESITEGMWFEYFTEVGMEPEPQPESFALKSKKIYTPDFYLPNQEAYVEIKSGNTTEEALNKAAELATLTGRMVLWLDGRPNIPDTLVMAIGPGNIFNDQPESSSNAFFWRLGDLQPEDTILNREFTLSTDIDKEAQRRFEEDRANKRNVARNPSGMTDTELNEFMQDLRADLSRVQKYR